MMEKLVLVKWKTEGSTAAKSEEKRWRLTAWRSVTVARFARAILNDGASMVVNEW